jgi:hypothetical protein
MELAPELQFKHFTVREAQLPGDALVSIEGLDLDGVAICCDLDSHVFFDEHTEPQVADALRASHWFDLREWVERSPGTGTSTDAGPDAA